MARIKYFLIFIVTFGRKVEIMSVILHGKNKSYVLKTSLVLCLVCFLFPESLLGLTGGGTDGATAIKGLDNVWKSVRPYLTGLFSIGGVVYSGINIRKVVIGDYRAAAPAAIAAIVASLGINGMFGENALSVLLP